MLFLLLGLMFLPECRLSECTLSECGLGWVVEGDLSQSGDVTRKRVDGLLSRGVKEPSGVWRGGVQGGSRTLVRIVGRLGPVGRHLAVVEG